MREIVYSARSNNSTPSMIAIGQVKDMLCELTKDRRVIIITDQNLLRSHHDIISLYPYIIIGQGEENKNLTTIETIHRELLAMEADRTSYIVGIGGGIVTDVTGFAASTYMRGVGFGFVATSLLAQVDASVGGKNGVNLDGYKNIIGTFNQPDFVLCDISLMKTLPEREMRAGMSEALKCGILGDPDLLEIFEKNSFEQIVSSEELLTEIVVRSVRFKASIVEQDEREAGMRKLLNLGHTFGHSIEKCGRRHIHGEAVAIGLAIIADLSIRIAGLSEEDRSRIISALRMLELPTTTEIPFEELLQAAKSDKKRAGDSIELILIDSIGQCVIRKISITELLSLGIEKPR